MKLLIIIFWLYLVFIPRMRAARILVKFHMVSQHYKNIMEKGRSAISADPFEILDLPARQVLCDLFIKSRQYAGKSSDQHKSRITLTEWGSSDKPINYQRWAPLESSMYQERSIRIHDSGDNFKKIKVLQCVNTPDIQWFITYGGAPHYAYLIESSPHRHDKRLRLTGLFEPEARVEDRTFEYFFNQYQTKRDAMRYICNLKVSEYLRLCSVVHDTLGTEGYLVLKEKNYIRTENIYCVRRVFKEKDRFWSSTLILPCITVNDQVISNSILASFYLLADTLERDAVFVFLSDQEHRLTLTTRVTGITSLSEVGLGKHTGMKRKQKKNFSKKGIVPSKSEYGESSRSKGNYKDEQRRKSESPIQIKDSEYGQDDYIQEILDYTDDDDEDDDDDYDDDDYDDDDYDDDD